MAAEERPGGQEQGPQGREDWFQWYHVERGDTLSGIAGWWYGSSEEHWGRRIWLANRRTIGEDPNFITPCQWLKLPYSGFSYHIERDDTLFQLAQWVYGDGSKCDQIHEHEANRWIQDPNQIEVGRRIWVP